MGRKIPGKKHKTIKYPHLQSKRRLERLKVNDPPANSDEQELPKSLLRIMELKQMAKSAKFKKPKKFKSRKLPLSVEKILDKDPIQKGMTKSDGYIPNLVQKPNETPEGFLNRLSTMTQNLINEVEFEKKFSVEIQRNPETGEVIQVKNEKKKKKSKKKKLSVKRKEKILAKKEELSNVKDFNQLKDIVQFGEVVHRPPNLITSKKLKDKEQKPRYGSLLLNNVINGDIKIKNKLPDLQKEKAEAERKFIVEAYRKAKKTMQEKNV